MAKKKDYIPARDDALVTYHDNLKTQVAALVGQAGITAGDSTAVNTDNANLHTAISDVASADAVKQSKVAAKTATVATVKGNTRCGGICGRRRDRDSSTVDLQSALGLR